MQHAERLAHNEAVFRGVNERIREAAGHHDSDGHIYEFVCECANSACVDRVRLTIPEYESIRSSGTHFVLAKGHEVPEVEKVVAEKADHLVVEKVGVAGGLADALDPRT